MTEEDPLAELLLDAEEVDRARLARGLKGILGIDTETGRIVIKPGFTALNSRQKILAYLLGRKAAFLLGVSESEAVTPKEIPDETGLPSGTVHPTLKGLRESRSVSQVQGGAYFLGAHQVLDALEAIEKG